MRWTKKAALERMANNQGLQQVYERYPLAKLLVESATHFRRYSGYHRIACYYTYKDWVHAVTLHENEDFWTCVKVIDDLLPPDDSDMCKENGSCISSFNPPLPGLPPRPDRPVEYDVNGKRKLFYRINELDNLRRLGEQRHLKMRDMLEEVNRDANS